MQSASLSEPPPSAVAILRHSKLSLVQHCAAIGWPSTLVAVGSVTQTSALKLFPPSITQTPLEGKAIGATGDGAGGGDGGGGGVGYSRQMQE